MERVAIPEARDKSSRRKLWLSLLPLLIPAALCLFSLAQRTLAADTAGTMEQREAHRIASNFCTQITGHPIRVVEASQIKGTSYRKNKLVREWDVVCDSGEDRYLLRINAENGRVFGVNRLSQASTHPREVRITRRDAERTAKRYFTMLGVRPHAIQVSGQPSIFEQEDGTRGSAWNFRLQIHRADLGRRTMSLSIDALTGDLVCAWNPSSSL
jgi:hypothetical protein